MPATSDNAQPTNAAASLCRWLGPVAAIVLMGCAGPEPIWPQASSPQRAEHRAFLSVYPPVPQILTAAQWERLVARHRGQILLVCIWRASDPNVVSCLHESREIQAQYRGSRVLGLNLDAPEAWLSTAVPILRQAQARFPVVTCDPEQREAILRHLGLDAPPKGVTYVVLSPVGWMQEIRQPLRPAGLPAVAPQAAVASQPAVVSQPAINEPPTPASQPAATRPVDAFRYHLRIVRLADNATIGHFAGLGRMEDLTQTAGSAETRADAETAGWLRVLGIELASRIPLRGRVAVGPIRSGLDPTVGQEFASAVAAALKERGRGVTEPTAVEAACRNLGISAELLETRPSAIEATLDAEYILLGSIVPEHALSEP